MTTNLLSVRPGTGRTGRSFIGVMLVAAVAIFASIFGGTWVAHADEAPGTSPTTLPGTVPTEPDPEPEAPAGPEIAIAVAGDGEAGVVWAAPRVGEPGDGVSYLVTSTPDSGELVVDAPVRHVVVEGLTNGLEYVFSVVAVGPSGSSAPTTTNAVTPDSGEAFSIEQLQKLERHLQDKLNKAHGRFHDARGKARAKFEKHEG
ncbi:MAG: fibronectin type III domain-containing protein, partial [Chloroflexi bacterium]|nr:fibronectin type III domain-containing protein [Chloroflexota bacterium]